MERGEDGEGRGWRGERMERGEGRRERGERGMSSTKLSSVKCLSSHISTSPPHLSPPITSSHPHTHLQVGVLLHLCQMEMECAVSLHHSSSHDPGGVWEGGREGEVMRRKGDC